MDTTLAPVVDGKLVRAVLQQARDLDEAERRQFLHDLEQEPEVGSVVVGEVRAHLQLGTP